MRAKDVGTSRWRHAHSSRSRWTDGGKSGTPVIVPLAAVEDSSGKPGARVDIAGGWFRNWFLVRFLNWGRGRRLRRLGQTLGRSLLLPDEAWAKQQDGCQRESPCKHASVHTQLVPTQRTPRAITRGEASP